MAYRDGGVKMSYLKKLGINRKTVYDNLVKIVMPFIDNATPWHFWKFYIWPNYSQMLEALIENTMNTEKCGAGWDHFRNIEIIEKATGKKWAKIKELLK